MSRVQVSDATEGQQVTIWIKGRFDFGLHKEFRAAYKERDVSHSSFVVNMRDVEYMDSSALGMLLMLREQVKASGGQVSIVECNPEIEKILRIANFEKLFDIN